MFRMLCACVTLVLIGHSVSAEDAAAVKPLSIRYTAVLSETTANGASQPKRDFEIRCLVLPQTSGFPAVLYLMDQTSDEQPWHAQFGRIEFDAEGLPSPGLAAQRHTHGGQDHWVKLRLGVFPAFARLAPDVEWTEGNIRYRLIGELVANAEPCWQLEIDAPMGRRTTLLLQKSNGAIVVAKHRFFMGMGEQFDLTLKLEELTTAEPATVATWTKATAPLLKLKQQLPSESDTEATDSATKPTPPSLETLAEVDQATDGTPFAALAGVIRKAVTAGQQREQAIADLAAKFVGRPAPPIAVTRLDGGEPLVLSQPGKITILHFWEYQEKPLAEPYGQIGYLDFLAQKHKDSVQVVGIISHKQIQDPKTAKLALQSARKLREFMNIGYSLGHETKGALSALGDPRTFDVDLPLWVVIGKDGTVLHYHVGYYEVDSSRGLEELDRVVEQALKGK
jgi:hypothetical protein